MKTEEYNKILVEKYPFLLPRNLWTDEPYEDYDYSYTKLDSMPNGWRKAFGEQMCKEIAEILKEADWVDKYRITQIKEKFGSLCWYYGGVPSSISQKLHDCVNKYGKLSFRTCISCGKPATVMSTGWISPFCDDCSKSVRDKFIPIEEFIKEWNDE